MLREKKGGSKGVKHLREVVVVPEGESGFPHTPS